MEKEITVISLGGSLIVPAELDINFLKEFKSLILDNVAQGKKFVIITGGGITNRKYNDAARELGTPTNDDLDWIGIAALKLNAELVRVMFAEHANARVVENLSQPFSFEKSIVVGSAFKPGQSSDWCAIEAAKTIGAKKIVNLSNTDHVYDSDPRVNPNAKKIESMSWAEYRKIIPKEWSARLSTPFDPVASAVADAEKIQVAIINGKPISNLANYLNGEGFLGTIIS